MRIRTVTAIVLASIMFAGCGDVVVDQTPSASSVGHSPACSGKWVALPSLFPDGIASYVGGVDNYVFGSFDYQGDYAGQRGLIAKIDPTRRSLTRVVGEKFQMVHRIVKFSYGGLAVMGTMQGQMTIAYLQEKIWRYLSDEPTHPLDMCGTRIDDLYIISSPNKGEVVLNHQSVSDPYQITLDGDLDALTCIGDSVFVSTRGPVHQDSLISARLFQVTNGSVTELNLKPGTTDVWGIAGSDPKHIYISTTDERAVGHLAYLEDGKIQNEVTNVFGKDTGTVVLNLHMVGDNVVAGTTYTSIPDACNGQSYADAVFFGQDLSPTVQSLKGLLTLAKNIWQSDDGVVYAVGEYTPPCSAASLRDQVVMCVP